MENKKLNNIVDTFSKKKNLYSIHTSMGGSRGCTFIRKEKKGGQDAFTTYKWERKNTYEIVVFHCFSQEEMTLEILCEILLRKETKTSKKQQ